MGGGMSGFICGGIPSIGGGGMSGFIGGGIGG